MNILLKKTLYTSLIFLLAVFFIFPFVIMLLTTFKSAGELQQAGFTLLPKDFTLSNYIESMKVGNWGRYFLNSTIITIITVIISLFLNSMAGFAFSRLQFKGRDIFFSFSLIAMAIPEQVIMIPVFLNLKNFPLTGGNDIFGVGGSGLINTYAGLIIPFIAHPFGVFLCKQAFINFPKALDEAATIDGCSKFRIYWNIYLPLSIPTLITLGLLKTVATWNQYTWPLILTSGEEMRTVQLALSNYSTEYTTNWGYVMSATTIIILPIILLFIALQKYYVAGVVSSGVKG